MLRISGRKIRKEALFTLENKFSDVKRAAWLTYTPPATIEVREGSDPLALSRIFLTSWVCGAEARLRAADGLRFGGWRKDID